MKSLLIVLISLMTFQVSSALLDKTTAVFNDKIITLSMVKRHLATLNIRKSIAPFIYSKASYSQKGMTELIIQKNIIREKLKEMGYVISDNQVEEEIKRREKALNYTRDQILAFLKQNGISYEEFFEITREAQEFNYFNSIIIVPLVSVSEQEIKNEFYQRNRNNKTVSFKYNLVDLFIKDGIVKKKEYPKFKKALNSFRKGGPLPQKYSSLETVDLGDVREEDLHKSLMRVVKNTQEGKLSKPVIFNGSLHVFFVKKRDVVESSFFVDSKLKIRNSLFEKKAKEATALWFKRERSNFFIKSSL